MNTFICFGWYVKKHKATFFKHIPFKSTLHDFCTTLRTILLLSNKPIPESILLRFPFAYASQFFPPISTHSWKAKVKYLNTTATKGKKRKVGSSSTIGLGILCEPAPLAMLKVEFIVRFTRTHENAFRRSAVLLTSTFQLHPATTRAAHFSANIGFHWIILAFKRPTATINFLHISLILVLATTFAGFFFCFQYTESSLDAPPGLERRPRKCSSCGRPAASRGKKLPPKLSEQIAVHK